MSNSASWQMTTIGDACDILAGYGFPKHLQGKQEGDYPFYKVGDISQAWVAGKINLTTANNYLSDNEARNLKAKPLPPGTTVLAKIGEAIKLNRRAMLSVLSLVDNNVMGIVPKVGKADPKYIFYFLLTVKLGDVSQATTVPSVRKSDVADIPLPLAPLEIQKEIVAEIEKQFSRLDDAVTALKRIQTNLKRYKAAVLKAAVEGKLTEQWRKEHPNVEPADQLLNRILAERRAKWETEELAKMKSKGIKPKDDSWKKKYKEPAGPDTANLPELPEGWAWSKSDQLFSFVTSGSRGWASYYSETGPIFLRMGNLDHDTIRLDLTDIQRVQPPVGSEGLRTRVCSGDILVSITADVGMVGLVPDGFEEAYINQHVSLARPLAAINSTFLAWHLASKTGQGQFKELQRGATKVGLGLDDIKSVNVPIPPLKEQQAILEEIDRRLSVTEELETTIETSLKRAELLRQSILSKLFTCKHF